MKKLLKMLLKILLIITGSAEAFNTVFLITQKIISVRMCDYYKSRIDDLSLSTEVALEKAMYWRNFGDVMLIPEIVLTIVFFSFYSLALISLILKFISLTGKKCFLKKAQILSGASCILSIIINGIDNSFGYNHIFDLLLLICFIVFLLISFFILLKNIVV